MIPALFFSVGCSQIGPSQDALKTELQNTLPSHWEVVRIERQSTENLGSNVDPVVQSRFKAVLRLKEDVFAYIGLIPELDERFQSEVTYVDLTGNKGTEKEVYGLSTSNQYMDSWSTEFEFDDDEVFQLGDSISLFSLKPMIKDSQEAEEFIAKSAEKMMQEHQAIAAILKSGKTLTGETTTNNGTRETFLTVTSFNDSDKTIEGYIEKPWGWYNGKSKITGVLDRSVLHVDEFDDTLDTKYGEYTLNLAGENTLSGTWLLVSQNAILWGGNSSGTASLKMSP